MLSDDWRAADVEPHVMATLVYLERLTHDPVSIDDTAVDTALAAGASPGGLEQATLMAMLFAYMNRMVDAFGADATPEEAEQIARRLETVGNGFERLSTTRPWTRWGGDVPSPLVEMLGTLRTGDGDAPAELRACIEAVVAGRSGATRATPEAAMPPAVERLVDTLAHDGHGVTDRHIDDLRPDWSEAAIYELIFVASFAAGLGRLERSAKVLADR